MHRSRLLHGPSNSGVAPICSSLDFKYGQAARVAKNAPYALRVRDLLTQRAPECCNMASVARALGLSVRTLRRQQSAEGTSFREIEYAALASLARHMLCDKQLTIQETAYAMGFSTPPRSTVRSSSGPA